MDGYVDYFTPSHGVTLRKKTWKRRFLRLDAAFHALEVFTDATMGERKHRIALTDAHIATADELGALLSSSTSSKIALEHSRRFVLRITERDVGTQAERHHYVCAEVQAPDIGGVDTSASVDVRASRQYLQQWLDALRQCVRSGATGPVSSTENVRMDARELSRCIAAYSERLHLAAFVSNRDVEHNKSVFEISVKAWILQRELVQDNTSVNDSSERTQRRPASPTTSSWQVLEYACAWKARKTSAAIRDFDAQLRQFCDRELRDIAVPSSSTSRAAGVVHHLLHSAAHAEQERVRRIAAMDAYVQQLLCLPALSAFGSEASAMLDHFLEITPHLAPLRQLEKASGQSMHLRTRQVVPWHLREQFEQLYRQHLDAAQAASDAAQRPQTAHRASKHDGERRRSAKPYGHHEQHDRRRESSKPHARSSHVESSAERADQRASESLEAVRPARAVEVSSLLCLADLCPDGLDQHSLLVLSFCVGH